MIKWPDEMVLRDWQKRAVADYQAKNKRNYTADVVPGGGKTIYSLRIGYDGLMQGRIRRIVVVVHTDHLRNQWVAQAAQFGMVLLPEVPQQWGPEHGIVITYQQLSGSRTAIRRLVTSSQRVFVIFDEIHHVAENARWGSAVGMAFSEAYRRLMLTGTPFRHDESKITFVTYKHGQAVIDFRYTYRQALKEGVVVPIFFPTIGGKVRWSRGDVEFESDFDQVVSQKGRADRLDTAIEPDNKWLRSVIKDANKRLDEMRESGHSEAAGLIICKDQAHAQAVAALVKQVTRKTPVIAISDIADSAERIEAFKCSSDKWLVAVRMVSEGVDIPRLRVGVYATNITTELFFRQVIGRFIRTVPGLEDQSAFLYIPRDPLIVQYAQDIQEERHHILREQEVRDLRSSAARKKIEGMDLRGLSAEAFASEIIAGDHIFTPEELTVANEVKRMLGLWYLSDVVVAQILKARNAL